MFIGGGDRAGGVWPTTPQKLLSSMVKALYFQNSGRPIIFEIEVLFKWSDQSCTPSAAPGGGEGKMAD